MIRKNARKLHPITLLLWNEAKRQGYTIPTLARALETTRGHVHGWYKGKTIPSGRYVWKLMELLDLEIRPTHSGGCAPIEE